VLPPPFDIPPSHNPYIRDSRLGIVMSEATAAGHFVEPFLCRVAHLTGGVLRICFSDCPELGPSSGSHLTGLSPCRSSRVSYSICPQARLPLLMEFQQSSEGAFGVLCQGQEGGSVRGFPGVPLRRPPSSCQQAMLSFFT